MRDFAMHVVLAYIDPGSGSVLLQILLAGVFGALFILKTSWSRVSGYLRRLFSGRRHS